MIAELIERDAEAFVKEGKQDRTALRATPAAQSSTSTSGDQERLARLEADCTVQMAELRAELPQAKQTEDRLRDDRDQWRQTAEYLQENSQQGPEDEEQEDGEEEED